ncbi:MAG: hypothetical protein CVU64_14055 [Deltaproteobacteria bacterium HGW-Deltaproteobacteria-21]|nr:MAG: hypothetical protein CVU64_14055 [Deltaproteobacteria bacterium HGW-Deltaproteobacteria-21]
MRKGSITHKLACRLCGSAPVWILLFFALLFSSPPAMASLPTGGPGTVTFAVRESGITFTGPLQVAQRNPQNERTGNRYEQWQKMKPDEKETLRRRNNRWKQMAPQDRQRYQQRFEQWKNLSPDEQRQIDRKLENWKDLSPSEREDVRKKFR